MASTAGLSINMACGNNTMPGRATVGKGGAGGGNTAVEFLAFEMRRHLDL